MHIDTNMKYQDDSFTLLLDSLVPLCLQYTYGNFIMYFDDTCNEMTAYIFSSVATPLEY